MVCDCGHAQSEHYRNVGMCLADVWRAELGRSFKCFCPQWDPVDGPEGDAATYRGDI